MAIEDNGYTVKELQELFNSEKFDVKGRFAFVRDPRTGENYKLARVELYDDGVVFQYDLAGN